ncbi:MAG: LemA family protein [Rhodospirillales bacterium]
MSHSIARRRPSGIVRALLVTAFALSLSACGVNAIPTKDEAVTAAWSQVVNQYKRRADLIPNLVTVVKEYAAHERETLTAVTQARASATQTTISPDILTNPQAFQAFEQSQGALSSALSRLMLVVERYPDLKSNQNFLSLQSQIEGTENRISVARRDYILAVQDYNTEIRTFPGRVWAWILYSDATPKQNFSVENEAAIENPPEVKF